MNDKIALELLEYIVDNMFLESPFLSPHTNTHIELIGLLDKIAELRGISKEQNGREFNSVIDEKYSIISDHIGGNILYLLQY